MAVYSAVMNKTVALMAALFLALGTLPSAAGERPIVVELFTSEGLLLLPAGRRAADRARRAAGGTGAVLSCRLLGQARLEGPVLQPRRPRRASTATPSLLGLATVYTPQIVVDGQWQAVGSSRAEVERAIGAGAAQPRGGPGRARGRVGASEDRDRQRRGAGLGPADRVRPPAGQRGGPRREQRAHPRPCRCRPQHRGGRAI